MKTRQQLAYIAILTIALLAMTGCASLVSTTPQLPTATVQLTFTPLPTITVTAHPTKTIFLYTPPPTLLPDQEHHMAELLQSQECILPCYLGIIPGKTSLSEAKAILDSLGASFKGEYTSDDVIEYSYNLDIGDPLVPNATPGSSALVYQNIHLKTKPTDTTVRLIHIVLGTENTEISFETYRKYWTRYSTRQIFTQLGRPDQLYTASKGRGKGEGSAIILVYGNRGVYVDLRGAAYETSICNEKDATQIFIQMDLFDPESSINADEFNEYLHDTTVWLPIKDAIGVDAQEFYKLVSTYPSVCFLY
jgi:hypothetical protein